MCCTLIIDLSHLQPLIEHLTGHDGDEDSQARKDLLLRWSQVFLCPGVRPGGFGSNKFGHCCCGCPCPCGPNTHGKLSRSAMPAGCWQREIWNDLNRSEPERQPLGVQFSHDERWYFEMFYWCFTALPKALWQLCLWFMPVSLKYTTFSKNLGKTPKKNTTKNKKSRLFGRGVSQPRLSEKR